jgi:hypothetical protein
MKKEVLSFIPGRICIRGSIVFQKRIPAAPIKKYIVTNRKAYLNPWLFSLCLSSWSLLLDTFMIVNPSLIVYYHYKIEMIPFILEY